MSYAATPVSSRCSFVTRACFILCASASFCRAQSAPAPPGHLPRVIGVCETAASYAACTVWIWQGSSYSAIWQNGAVSTLKVASGDSGDLRIERQDSAGPVAGLIATYTAKWDGKAFSDGKVTATLKGGTTQLSWTGTPAITPVVANPGQNYSYVNWYTQQLTGYAIYNNKGNFNMSVGPEIDDFRLRGEAPMNPGESRPFTQRYYVAPPNYGKGVAYPQAASIAAIYSDGTTFGDDRVLKTMLERRRLMTDALTSIGTTLCTMGGQAATIADISTALDKQHATQDARAPEGKEARDAAYSYVQKSLTSRSNSHLTASQAVKRTWDQLNQLRSGLAADPVKDGGGNSAVPPVTPLACNLP